MGKVRISKVFEVSKYLTTKAGQELQEVLYYLSEFVNDFISNLSNGLSYSDNFACELKTVSVFNGVETVIKVGGKKVYEIKIRQVIDDTYYATTGFGWKYNAEGDIVAVFYFVGTPPASRPITLNLILFNS